MGFQRSYGWYCSTDPREIAAAVSVPGTTAVTAGPAIFQALGASLNPGAAYTYPNGTGGSMVRPAFDPTPSIAALRQIRAAGKSAVLKMLFYSQDSTDVTQINPGSADGALSWCQAYFETVLDPFFNADLPSGAEFDVLNLETELNQITAPYPAAWTALIQQIRAAGFSGVLTSSANDPSASTTPWAGSLDWFGYDHYPTLTNATYAAQYPDAGNVSDPQSLADFFRSTMPLQAISNRFDGIPIYFGEFGFGYGPYGSDPGGPPWTSAELLTMSAVLFETLGPLACWAGMSVFSWPYDTPSGQASYPPASLLQGLSSGWHTYRDAPDLPVADGPGPGSLRGSGPRQRTVVQARSEPATRLDAPSWPVPTSHLRQSR
jgi:hypothetical protein